MRSALFLGGMLLAAGCAGRASVSTGESDPSCTRMTWWLQARPAMSLGDSDAVTVGHCIGRKRPVRLKWVSSNPSVVRILVADDEHALVQAKHPGVAKIMAWSEIASERSAVTIRVVTDDARTAD